MEKRPASWPTPLPLSILHPRHSHTLTNLVTFFVRTLRSCCTLFQSLAFHFFFRNSRSFFCWPRVACFCHVPPLFSLCTYSCVCVYLGAFCGARFCVQVRSFNFDLCFRLFCVAFVDFCHLNRNFYFLHVPMAMAASFGFVFGWPAAAVASWPVFCACVVLARRFPFFSFFLSFLFFLLTHVHGALPTRTSAEQIGFLFSDIWNWRTPTGDHGCAASAGT